MRNCLIFRLSSFGDVLLTLPVLEGLCRSEPPVHPILVTKPAYKDYFDHIEGLEVFTVDTVHKYRGITGLFRLFKNLQKQYDPKMIIDLHQVFRTRFINNLFLLSGVPIFRINKGRNEKRVVVRNKDPQKLKHTVERYLDSFKKAGLDFRPVPYPFESRYPLNPGKEQSSDSVKIGLAPFSKHTTKEWPIKTMTELVEALITDHRADVYVFGGQEDEARANTLSSNDRVHVLCGKLNPVAELETLSQMNLMISMDSANMHLANLMGIHTISIWGATHPHLGFRPYNESNSSIIQAGESDLDCRPCSVYGNKPCARKDDQMKCMSLIKPDHILKKVHELLPI